VRRRSMLLLPALVCADAARAATLPAPRSLPDELAAALQRGRPLLVMASLDGCPFCKRVRDGFLVPLRAGSGQPIVQLDLGSAAVLSAFDAKPSTHDQLLRSWKVTVAPTVLFFGRGGREVAERLVGASIPDYYGAYLEQRLQAALKSLS
jgi:thioredoxin-related protein